MSSSSARSHSSRRYVHPVCCLRPRGPPTPPGRCRAAHRTSRPPTATTPPPGRRCPTTSSTTPRPAPSTPAPRYLIEADGTIETISHEITRFNGRKGVEKLGEYRNIIYTPRTRSSPSTRPASTRPTAAPSTSSRATPSSATSPPITRSTTATSSSSSLSRPWKSATSSRSNGRCAARTPSTTASSSRATPSATTPIPSSATSCASGAQGDAVQVRRDRRQARADDQRRRQDAHSISGSVNNRRQLPQDDDLPSKEELRLQRRASTFASWEEVGHWKQTPARRLLGLHRRGAAKWSKTQRAIARRRRRRPAP